MLFHDDEPKPIVKAVDSAGAVKSCIDRFYNRFVAKFNPGVDVTGLPKEQLVRPIVKGGKHGKQFKELIAQWGQPAVEEVIDRFFATTDPVITRSDYSYDYFLLKAQYLRLAGVRNTRQLDDRQLHNMEAAARATGRKRIV
jgi:hypothetical protein